MSLSIQLMKTFKPSSGIQSNLVVGVDGFILNFPPRNHWGPLHYVTINCTWLCTVRSCQCTCTYLVSAMSACAALRAQRRAQCACMQRINQCMIDLHWFNTHELKMDMFSISIDLTRTSSKWICFRSPYWFNTHKLKMDMFGYVWNRDVTILQFGYAAYIVEIFYVRWSILDQSLHWDLFMRDIKKKIEKRGRLCVGVETGNINTCFKVWMFPMTRNLLSISS